MRRAEESSEALDIGSANRVDGLEHARIFADDMTCAARQRFWKQGDAREVRLGRVAQLGDAQCQGCLFAFAATRAVVARRVAVLDP